MVISSDHASRIRRRPLQITRGTHMFGAMDLGAKIAIAVTITAVVGLVIVVVRRLGAQKR